MARKIWSIPAMPRIPGMLRNKWRIPAMPRIHGMPKMPEQPKLQGADREETEGNSR